MHTTVSNLAITLLDSIHQVAANDWDALWLNSNDGPLPNPFLTHRFLAALEDSGCTDAESGWEPKHLVIHTQDDTGTQRLVAAMPLYQKAHSYGEYVFDWSWADAYHRNGLNYYPKLLSAIPFTPATGHRLAVAESLDVSAITTAVHDFLAHYCQQQALSGWHCLFLPQTQTSGWQQAGSRTRTGCQFHWYNRGFTSFDEFLETFNSRKRKAVRKERRQVTEQGVTLVRLTGDEITAADWDRFYRFYHTTYFKRSGNSGYLNRAFFERIGQCLADQLLMVNAIKDGVVIASALCFFDSHHLYGRYWGCMEEVSGLHFEACYYQGIEFAIEKELAVFDPGAQGEHKIQRGFEPTLTYSQHWLTDHRFMDAVDNFLQQETPGVQAYQQDCSQYLPFKQTP